MSEFPRSEIRVGDDEREGALRALGEHMSAGRLDLTEYGERTARVTAAKTRGELAELFADLPPPYPTFEPVVPTLTGTEPAERVPADRPARWEDRPAGQRMWAALVPLSAILAGVLFIFVFRGMFWPIFFLPLAVTMAGGAMWGEDWRRDRREFERRRRGHRGLHGQ